MIPVRCFTCNKCVGHLYESYHDYLRNQVHSKDALDNLGLKRTCCRRMLLTNVDIIETASLYKWNDRQIKSGLTHVYTENPNDRWITNVT